MPAEPGGDAPRVATMSSCSAAGSPVAATVGVVKDPSGVNSSEETAREPSTNMSTIPPSGCVRSLTSASVKAPVNEHVSPVLPCVYRKKGAAGCQREVCDTSAESAWTRRSRTEFDRSGSA